MAITKNKPRSNKPLSGKRVIKIMIIIPGVILIMHINSFGSTAGLQSGKT